MHTLPAAPRCRLPPAHTVEANPYSAELEVISGTYAISPYSISSKPQPRKWSRGLRRCRVAKKRPPRPIPIFILESATEIATRYSRHPHGNSLERPPQSSADSTRSFPRPVHRRHPGRTFRPEQSRLFDLPRNT